MSFIILLLLGLIASVQVETRTAESAKEITHARANALLGMQVALGQLQKHTGSDQVVTAPATNYYADADGTSWDEQKQAMRNWVATAANSEDRISPYGTTRMTESERTSFVDSYTDFWNEKQPYWTGVWESGSRGSDGDFLRNQQPYWLVSGFDSNNPTTVSPVNAVDSNYVTLVGEGSANDTSEPSYTAVSGELSGIVQAPKVSIQAGSGQSAGAYAYYVSDESMKINVGLTDPYGDVSQGAESYNFRLYSPQRSGLEAAAEIDSAYQNTPWDVNDSQFARLISNDSLPLVQPEISEEMVRRHFHSITTDSSGLFTDAARGGLRKDLSYYLATGSGLTDNASIADPALYSEDARIGDIDGGFPASVDNLPTWEQLRQWANNVSNNSFDPVSVSEDVAPMLMHTRLFFGYSVDNGTSVYLHYLPVLVLWNPYDVPLRSTEYSVRANMWFKMHEVRIASKTDLPDGTADGTTIYNGYRIHTLSNPSSMHSEDFSSAMVEDEISGAVPENPGEDVPTLTAPTHTYAPYPVTSDLEFKFSASFEAGEILVFTPGQDQVLSLGSDVLSMDLENVYIGDQPGMLRQHILEIEDPIPDATEMIIFQSYDNNALRYSEDGYLAYFSLLADGKVIMDESWFGENHAWEVDGQLDIYNVPAGTVPIPQRDLGGHASDTSYFAWRPLYSLSEYQTAFQETSNLSNSASVNSPISLMSRFAIQPLTSVDDDGKFATYGQGFFKTYSRVFANQNLSAEKLMPNPAVDLDRGRNTSHNTDKFARYHLFSELGFSGSGRKINRQIDNWDDDIYNIGSDGRARGFSLITNTFSTFNKFDERSHMPIRSIRRSDVDLLSIGQFNQANLSQFFWQPGYAIGNSEANPYVSRQFMSGLHYPVDHGPATEPVLNGSENQVIDISYLLNDALWDGYFLSSIPRDNSSINLQEVIEGTASLPNARYRVWGDSKPSESDLRDLDNPAYYLQNTGAFNVNSTSIDAWKALLTSFRDLKIEGDSGVSNPDNTVPVARSTDPLGDRVDFTSDAVVASTFGAVPNDKDYYNVLSGFRYLTDEMIEALAERIVDEVKLRGPFYSLSDFVNRRLLAPNDDNGSWTTARTINDPAVDAWLLGNISEDYDASEGLAGINGALQRAINLSGINGGDNYPEALKAGSAYTDDWIYRPREQVDEDTGRSSFFAQLRWYLDTEHLAGSPAGENGMLFSHSPGFISQADILSMVGSALTTRGDTFKIRSYGEVLNPVTQEVGAKAWLEAVVQRIPDPVTDADQDREPDDSFGRQYKIINLRWLSEDEV